MRATARHHGDVGTDPDDIVDPPAAVTTEVRTADARTLHDDIGSVDPERITLRWCVPLRPAIVLGSRQSFDLVDAQRCAAAGVDVVRRRSGGGAVFVDPVAAVWIDVLVPLPHAAVGFDLRASMITVGRWWSVALESVLTPADRGRLGVHEGPIVADAWGDLVCFAGLGPGEVTLDGAKLVGLSQRRSRSLARIQAQVHLSDPTDRLSALLSHRPTGVPVRPAVLPDIVRPAGTPGEGSVAEALLDALARSVVTASIA